MLRRALVMMLLPGSLVLAGSERPADRLVREAESLFSGANELADAKPPRFAFSGNAFAVAPATAADARGTVPDVAKAVANKTTVALAADNRAAWIAVDLGHHVVCGMAECERKPPPPSDWFHATVLFEYPDPRPVAWHVGEPISYKDQKLALSKGPMLDPMPRQIDKGAEEVVKLFESTIGDPKAFARTVADRKDVVLYGSELSERYVGAAKVKKTIERWNLALAVQNGIQAGVTSSGTVAWVAAHLDATSAKKPRAGAKPPAPVPYRLFAIYERTGATWKLVSAQFSFTWN